MMIFFLDEKSGWKNSSSSRRINKKIYFLLSNNSVKKKFISNIAYGNIAQKHNLPIRVINSVSLIRNTFKNSNN